MRVESPISSVWIGTGPRDTNPKVSQGLKELGVVVEQEVPCKDHEGMARNEFDQGLGRHESADEGRNEANCKYPEFLVIHQFPVLVEIIK